MSARTVNQQWFETTDLQVSGVKGHSLTLDSATNNIQKTLKLSPKKWNPRKLHTFPGPQKLLPLAISTEEHRGSWWPRLESLDVFEGLRWYPAAATRGPGGGPPLSLLPRGLTVDASKPIHETSHDFWDMEPRKVSICYLDKLGNLNWLL